MPLSDGVDSRQRDPDVLPVRHVTKLLSRTGGVVPAMRSPLLVHESSLTSVSTFPGSSFCASSPSRSAPRSPGNVCRSRHSGNLEIVGCPFLLFFSSPLLSSLHLLIINCEETSFWRFECHKQILLVVTVPASRAGHFEETRNRNALLSQFSFVVETRSRQTSVHPSGRVILTPSTFLCPKS